MQIGVRELRQNASRYLALVQAGEVIDVTSRGRTVARLVPAEDDEWQQLVAAGEVQLPEHDELLHLQPADYGIDAGGALEAARQERT